MRIYLLSVATALLSAVSASAIDTQWSVSYNGVQYERQQSGDAAPVVVARGMTDLNAQSVSIAASVNFPNPETGEGQQEYITLPVDEVGMSFAAGSKSLRTVTVSAGVKIINDMAFAGCENLESASIGEGCDSIGAGAFSRCRALSSISLPASVSKLGTEIFLDCSSLASAGLGGAVSIPFKTFQHCTALTSVQAANAVRIHQYAFDGCTSLTSFTVQPTVEIIESGAFDDCTALAEIVFAETSAEIVLRGGPFPAGTLQEVKIHRPVLASADAFGRQDKCTRLLIGPYASFTVTDATRSATPFFAGFTGLREIGVNCLTPPPIEQPLFAESVFAQAILKVPAQSVASYRNAPYWQQFATIEAGNFAGTDHLALNPDPCEYRIEGNRLIAADYWKNARIIDLSGRCLGRLHDGSFRLPYRGIFLLVSENRCLKVSY